jgi:predicted nucleic acid-binding protein
VTIVVDASVVVAALVDSGPIGGWAEVIVGEAPLAAPQLLPAEVANVLRRSAERGDISEDIAALAHADLLDLSVELFAYEPLAGRVWELHHNLTSYDAWYVALAEALDAPLATLDARLQRSPGVRCTILAPP